MGEPVLLDAGTAVLVRGLEALAAYGEALESLFDRTGAPLAARWPSLDIWLRHHPRDEPWAVLVRRGPVPTGADPNAGGTLVGAAVLVRRPRFGCWSVGGVGTEGEPAHLAATDAAAANALAGGMARALRGLDRPWRLRLTDLPDPDPVLSALAAELPVTTRNPGQDAPRLVFAPDRPLAAYLSRNTRAAVAKARNRIARDGRHADIDWTTAPGRVTDALPEIMDVHRLRNVQLRGRSAFDDPTEASLFEALVRRHAAAGRVRLLSVRIDGALAAFALCLVDGDMLWVYANLVAPDWLRYSAGTIANAEVVRWAYAAPGVAGVDWGAGPQRYKLSGAVTLRRSQQLDAWSSQLLRFGTTTRHRLNQQLPA